MARGAYSQKNYKLTPAKAQSEIPPLPRTSTIPFTATKPVRTNTDWKASLRKPKFLSRNTSETKLAGIVPEVQLEPAIRTDEPPDTTLNDLPSRLNTPDPTLNPNCPLTRQTDSTESIQDTFQELTLQQTQSNNSSLYSRDSTSIYSNDSSSICSSASSIYSSGASVYSFDDYGSNRSPESIAEEGGDGFPINQQYPQRIQRVRTINVAVKQPPQDAAAREASTLAKKAAMFRNSRLQPNLPSFTTSLRTWSTVCRAAQASLDCYDSQATVRRGTYTPANTSKDLKAMIIDDQMIDDSRLIIVSIRGTEFKSLTDWAVNKAAKPALPTDFFDDGANLCHAGFLAVTKAMVSQVATQLENQHSMSPTTPALLFTGHSAGGAIAAMLYSHMLSTSPTISSELTALTPLFSSISCITFGAPPLSVTPLPLLTHHNPASVFLSFANEGDPVIRLADASYVKSLAKLLTASPPSTLAPPKVKVVRRSRGTSVIREDVVAPNTPWEELPLWPMPAQPLINAGMVVLLRDKDGKDGGGVKADVVGEGMLGECIFGDLKEHGVGMYIRRVREVALNAMVGMR